VADRARELVKWYLAELAKTQAQALKAA